VVGPRALPRGSTVGAAAIELSLHLRALYFRGLTHVFGRAVRRAAKRWASTGAVEAPLDADL